MNTQFFRDYGYTQEEIVDFLKECSQEKVDNCEPIAAGMLRDIAEILEREWHLEEV